MNFPFPGTGLNSDDSLDAMPVGDSPTTFAVAGRQNVIVPPDNFGRLEDAYGTALVAGSSLSVGTKYMGHVTDTDGEWCYYFMAGASTGSIIGVNTRDASTMRQVLINEAEVEFDTTIVFKHAAYIDGWLYWPSGQYGAKKVEITRAINFTLYKSGRAWAAIENYASGDKALYTDGCIYEMTDAGGAAAGEDTPPSNTKWTVSAYAYPNTASGTNATLLDGAFNLVEFPPLLQVTGEYSDDTSRLYNNLRGKMFQFTYRWKYRNGGYSNTAPFSELFLTPDVESYNGEILNSFVTNNTLTLYLDGGRETEVEYTELFVRTGQALSWLYVDKIEVGVNTYSFFNDYIMEVASDDMVNKLDNYIPRETRALELLSENVLVLGGNKYGFDNVIPDVVLTIEWNSATINAAGTASHTPYTLGSELITYPPDSIKERHWHEIQLTEIAGIADGDILHINLYYTTASINIVYVIQAADVVSVTTFRDKCIELINTEGAALKADYEVTDGVPSFTIENGDFYVYIDGSSNTIDTVASDIATYLQGDAAMNKWPQFTTGAKHVFGITYYDVAMRPFAIAANTDTAIYMPTVVEARLNGDLSSTDYSWRNTIAWEVKHEAPAEAKYWQWFYAGNQNIDDFWFYAIDSATAIGGVLSVVITGLQGVLTEFPLSQIGPYVWAKGDRIRCITKAAASSAYGALADTQVDLEIKAFNVDTSTLTLQTTTTNTYDFGAGSLVEIYRPKTSVNDDLFFAFGEIHNTYVLSANVYHEGETQDQTSTAAGYGAKGVFEKGDSYLIARAFEAGLIDGSAVSDLFLVESKSYSDFYDSDWYTQGKINLRSNIGEVELNNIAISNKLIQDTGINGLRTFEYDDVVVLPDKNGQINSLRQIGNVLRVIQQRKRTSFYVGMTEFYNQDGTASLVASSEILGNARELDGDWGTENPETVVKVDDILFFWDLHNRAFVQDSENGAFPISEYKMSKFFLELGDEIMQNIYLSDEYLLACDYHPILKTLFFYYYIENTGCRALLYHLPSKRWVSPLTGLEHTTPSVTYDLKGLIGAENRFFIVDNGLLYLMDATADRREYIGKTTKESAYITVVGNAEVLIPKIIDTVGLISNEKSGWAVDEIIIPADQTTLVDQSSKVFSADWLTREGITRAPVKRNSYTSGVYAYKDLWEGEKMRGGVVKVKFTLPTQTSGKVEVVALEIGMTKSNL